MRHLYTGTTEYLTVVVTATVTLNTQVVSFSFNNTNWYAAAWIGTAGPLRSAQLLINAGNLPAVGVYTLYVRVNDGTEIPVFTAGQVSVH